MLACCSSQGPQNQRLPGKVQSSGCINMVAKAWDNVRKSMLKMLGIGMMHRPCWSWEKSDKLKLREILRNSWPQKFQGHEKQGTTAKLLDKETRWLNAMKHLGTEKRPLVGKGHQWNLIKCEIFFSLSY